MEYFSNFSYLVGNFYSSSNIYVSSRPYGEPPGDRSNVSLDAFFEDLSWSNSWTFEPGFTRVPAIDSWYLLEPLTTYSILSWFLVWLIPSEDPIEASRDESALKRLAETNYSFDFVALGIRCRAYSTLFPAAYPGVFCIFYAVNLLLLLNEK